MLTLEVSDAISNSSKGVCEEYEGEKSYMISDLFRQNTTHTHTHTYTHTHLYIYIIYIYIYIESSLIHRRRHVSVLANHLQANTNYMYMVRLVSASCRLLCINELICVYICCAAFAKYLRKQMVLQ
jgi:hypothetical protein